MSRTRLDAAPRVLLAVLPLLAPACRVSVTLSQFDDLNRSLDIQTLIVAPDFSLYSPYRPERTAAFAKVVREELPAVAEVLGVTLERPVIVRLVVLASAERQVEIGPDKGTLAGWLHATREVVIYLDPDGEGGPGQGFPGPSQRAVIRHELAHACLHQITETLDQWLDEGVAEEVEAMVPAGNRLEPAPIRPLLHVLRRALPPSQRCLEKVLAWRRGTDPDVWARRLARALIRFLWERTGETTLGGAVRVIGQMTYNEILDLEAYWQEWIDGEGVRPRHWVTRDAQRAPGRASVVSGP